MNNPTPSVQSGNSARKPYHLRGKEPQIVKMRDADNLSWERIAVLHNCSVQAARAAYKRAKPVSEGEAA